jgi:mono/diheme cytochrome c family protein
MKKPFQVLILLSLATTAFADGNVLPRKTPTVVQSECASCHMLYPPAFLPKESWARLMGGLEKHYGVDASLDPKSVKEISLWLAENAGTYKRVSGSPPNDRITESAWFIKKHRKISDATWRNPKVKSKSNCMACHTAADKGNYDDDEVRVPK